jgi:hypothetical protein
MGLDLDSLSNFYTAASAPDQSVNPFSSALGSFSDLTGQVSNVFGLLGNASDFASGLTGGFSNANPSDSKYSSSPGNGSTVIASALLQTPLVDPGVQSYNTLVEPGVNGYFLVFLEVSPSLRANLLPQSNLLDDTWMIMGAAKSASIPQVTLNKIEYKGFNDVRLFTPTTLSYENTLSLSLYDTWDGKVYAYIISWLDYANPQGYTRSRVLNGQLANIKGNCLIVQYDPTYSAVVNAVLFFGVFPTSGPTISHSVDTNDLRVFDIQFSFDRMIFSPELLAKVSTSTTFGPQGSLVSVIHGLNGIQNSMNNSVVQSVPSNSISDSDEDSDNLGMSFENFAPPAAISLYQLEKLQFGVPGPSSSSKGITLGATNPPAAITLLQMENPQLTLSP